MPSDHAGPCVKFWGVRGSTPTPEARNLGYGGNTTCFEILSAGGDRLIVDAGSGIRKLGLELASSVSSVDVLLTHFHWDHIQGIPFFAPLFCDDFRIAFHSFPTEREIEARLKGQMADPYFTVAFDATVSECEFHHAAGEFKCGAFTVHGFPLNHPQGAMGYRIESQGWAVVVATDMEHGDPVLDKILRENSEGADVLIYDAQYTPAEYATRMGWGHSTCDEAARAARDAKVKQLVLFHHDPGHDDGAMDEIVKRTKKLFENTCAAREQTSIRSRA